MPMSSWLDSLIESLIQFVVEWLGEKSVIFRYILVFAFVIGLIAFGIWLLK